MESSLAAALSEWASVVGTGHVLTSGPDLLPYTANVSGLTRRIPAVIRPGTSTEVRDVVVVANRHRIPLYPLSTGRNLGLGSRLPVGDDQVVLDLGRMNRIREVNAEHQYAVVEPGVTQGQLSDYLESQGLPLMVNVTGAGRETSMIGNSLERGIGYFATRADTLTAMEVVLGDGRVLRTGFGHLAKTETAHIYRHGIGPDLGGLFCQSNYGVVTSAGVPLIPKCPCQIAAVLSIQNPEQLPRLVDALKALRVQGAIRALVHIGNRHRTLLAVGAGVAEQLTARGVPQDTLRAEVDAVIQAEGFGAWTAVWGIMGTPAEVRRIRRETRRALKGIGKLIFLTDGLLRFAQALVAGLGFTAWARRKALILPGVIAHHGLAKGLPTDEPLKSLHWALGKPVAHPASDADREGWGMLYCLPFVPLSGANAGELSALIEHTYGRYGFDAYITLNVVTDKALEAVINLAFDAHSEAACARAHDASRALHQALIDRGWMPYRVGIQEMAAVVDPDDEFWRVVRDLKKVLDPNGIIAPGRYNLV